MLSDEYRAYLLSDDWRSKRAKFLVGKVCAGCGSRAKLHVHHLDYANVFNETADDVVILCEICHKRVHKLHKQRNKTKGLRRLTLAWISSKHNSKRKCKPKRSQADKAAARARQWQYEADIILAKQAKLAEIRRIEADERRLMRKSLTTNTYSI